MKSIMTAVSPYLCEKIANGDCKILVRKTAPKEVPFKEYIYATKPKRFYKCGAVSTSNELLWLANGKVERGDGFKFWADGDEYQNLNGKVIGEFVCDKIYPLTAYSYDGGNADLGRRKLIETFTPGTMANYILDAIGMEQETAFDYLGEGGFGYGLHISDLKIYDKPRELSEFKTPPCEKPEKACENCKWLVKINTPDVYECECYVEDGRRITRPPSSWQYVEELRNE